MRALWKRAQDLSKSPHGASRLLWWRWWLWLLCFVLSDQEDLAPNTQWRPV